MTTIKDIKKHADSIRKCRTAESYYDKMYKDLSVADLLLVLEDENWHTEETLIETLVHMSYYDMVEICKILVEQDKLGHLPDDLYQRVRAIDDKNRNIERG